MRRSLATLVTLTVLFSSAPAALVPAPASATSTIRVGLGFDGEVRAIAVAEDGTRYIGGAFTRYGAFTGGGALLSTPTATVNRTFPFVNGTVNAAVSDGSGGWIIGGSFTEVDGQARSGLARIDSTGALTPFTIASDNVTVHALERSGTTLYVGYDTSVSGMTSHFVGEFDLTTGFQTSLPAVNGSVRAIAAHGGGLFIGGSFTVVDGEARAGLARIDATTRTVDTGWRADISGSSATVHAIVADAVGVVVGGSFTTVTDAGGAVSRGNLARLVLGTGSVQSWSYPTDGTVRTVALIGMTDVLLGGDFSQVTGAATVTRNRVARVPAFAGGSVDAWNPDVTGASVRSVVRSGDSVYLVGDFTAVGGSARADAAAVSHVTGAVETWDPALSQGGSASDPAAHALAADGSQVLVGGSFSFANIQGRNRLAAVAPDGTLTSWAPGANGTVSSVSVRGDWVYVGGSFTQVGTTWRSFLARVSTAGTVDPAWDPSPNGPVNAVAATPVGTYVGGTFSTIGGQSRAFLASLNEAGTAGSPAFDADAPVNALLFLAGRGVLVVGGSFTQVAGQPRGHAASINAYGGTLVNWDPALNGPVSALAAADTQEAFYVGGTFTLAGTTPAPFVARFTSPNAGTMFDAGYQASPNGPVNAIAVVEGSVVLGGSFSALGSDTRRFLGATTTSGSALAWTPAISAPVGALADTGAGSVAAGGQFVTSSLGGSSTGMRFAALGGIPASGPLTVTPTGFGDVTAGSTGTLTMTVTNTGSLAATPTAIDVSSVTRTGGTCAVGTPIPPSGSCTVSASWSPTSAGTLTSAAALIVDYGDGTLESFTSITGRAVDPPAPGGGGSGSNADPASPVSTSAPRPSASAGSQTSVAAPGATAKLPPARLVIRFARGSAELGSGARASLRRFAAEWSHAGGVHSTLVRAALRRDAATASDRRLATARSAAVTAFLRASRMPGTIRERLQAIAPQGSAADRRVAITAQRR